VTEMLRVLWGAYIKGDVCATRDLNAFMKWEKLGKSEADSPRFRQLLAVTKQAMAQRVSGQPSVREQITTAIKG